MRPLESQGLRYDGERLWVLDQRRLPAEETWVECPDVPSMVSLIQTLAIRGAPLIGVGAALALAQLAGQGASPAVLREAARQLAHARPTAVNLQSAMTRMVQRLEEPNGGVAALGGMAEALFDEDVALCRAIGRAGAQVLADGDGVLTHCNAGGLATAGIGTALGVIRAAVEEGKRLHVFVDETRPLLQGARLTAWELGRLGVPHTLICDNMAASVMRAGRIQKVVLGADRIAMNGDFANKIGTYSVAVAAKHHGVPFYTAAPRTTLDPSCREGADIPIEERAEDEVRGVSGAFGVVRFSSAQTPCFNPAFDVTPYALVTGWILDTGLYGPDEVRSGALRKLCDAGATGPLAST